MLWNTLYIANIKVAKSVGLYSVCLEVWEGCIVGNQLLMVGSFIYKCREGNNIQNGV
jgi:hypothetical protein